MLDFPAPRRHRMDHRDAQVLLQHIDHREHAPTGAEQIDGLRALAVLEEGALHVGIDLMRRQLADLIERRTSFPFAPSLNDWRIYYRFLLQYPERDIGTVSDSADPVKARFGDDATKLFTTLAI